jgi:hypothetical protein
MQALNVPSTRNADNQPGSFANVPVRGYCAGSLPGRRRAAEFPGFF